MNKKILLLLTPLLLLSSCNGEPFDAEEQRQNYDTALARIKSSSYTTYDVVGKGHAGPYDCSAASIRHDIEIPQSEDPEATNVSTGSMFLRLPIRLVAESVMAETVYTRFKSILNSSIDKKGVFYVDLENPDYFLHVYCPRIQKKDLNFYRVDTPNDTFSISARFSMDYYYNEYGYLVKEVVKTINSVTNDKAKTVDLEANYTYH